MIKKLLNALIAVLLLMHNFNFAQAPNLGFASGFALFTATGAFNVTGSTTNVTGDVGTKVGAFSGFPPGILIGQIHVADAVSAQAATDVALAYGSLSPVTCGQVIPVTIGGVQTLLPDVYCTGAATVINGDLILDGQGDATSLFIFKFNGALATTVNSRIILTNGASACNVYFQVNGQVDLGQNSIFQGTILANGAINLLDGASLLGRGLSQAGAISLQNNIVTLVAQPVASVIIASGPTTFCAGDSVILSGNVGGMWSNGDTTFSITVTTSGNFFVTNTTNCGSASSNQILVTVTPSPSCTITGKCVICPGASTQLCAPSGTGRTYLWSTGATSRCITVSTAGTYSVTVTKNGCSSTCSKTVTLKPRPNCSITGNLYPAPGQTTTLCTASGSGYTYLWNTGVTTRCLTISTAGTYSVTVTNSSGCTRKCSVCVRYNSPREASTLDNTPSLAYDNIEVMAYPNPFNTIATIEFKNATSDSHIVVELYTLTGNKISTLFDGNVEKDVTYEAEVIAEDLPGGIYIYKIVNGYQVITKRITLIK